MFQKKCSATTYSPGGQTSWPIAGKCANKAEFVEKGKNFCRRHHPLYLALKYAQKRAWKIAETKEELKDQRYWYREWNRIEKEAKEIHPSLF